MRGDAARAERAEKFLDCALKEVDRLRAEVAVLYLGKLSDRNLVAENARLGEEVRRLRKENEITGAASTRSVHRHNEALEDEIVRLRDEISELSIRLDSKMRSE